MHSSGQDPVTQREQFTRRTSSHLRRAFVGSPSGRFAASLFWFAGVFGHCANARTGLDDFISPIRPKLSRRTARLTTNLRIRKRLIRKSPIPGRRNRSPRLRTRQKPKTRQRMSMAKPISFRRDSPRAGNTSPRKVELDCRMSGEFNRMMTRKREF